MRHRLIVVCLFLASLVFGQVAALAHDVGHLDSHAPLPAECPEHYFAAQMGGGPISTPPTMALVVALLPAEAFISPRDVSMPARHAYFAQGPPAPLR